MKTSINIPDNVLAELLEFSKKSTKKDAILAAILEFNQRCRQKGLIKKLGTLTNFMSPSDLKKMRTGKEAL